MGRVVDEVGNRYGKLVVVSRAGFDNDYKVKWLCKCDCGMSSLHVGAELRRGRAKSCGCSAGNISHGMKHHPAYNSFYHARHRCNNTKDKGYPNYGGRGIQFKFASFEQFWEELGPTWKEGLTLDRKNNDGHYEPGNCRWATYSEQNSNRRNRRSSLHVTVNGQLLTLKQLSQVTGKSRYLIVKMYHKHGPNFRDWPIT